MEAEIGGFQQAGQRELVAPYAEPYFEVLEKVWAERSIEIAMRIVSGLFPRLVHRRSGRWSRPTPGSPSTRTPPRRCAAWCLECRDDLARALRAQSRDAAH